LLDDYHYSQHAKERILAYTAAHGTPSGCAYLDREDERDAEMIFVAELPAIPYDEPTWDDDGAVLLDVLMLLAGTHPFPVGEPEEGPDAPDANWYHPYSPNHPSNRPVALPPISGGAPGPFEADRRDFEMWLQQVDQPYPPDDQVEEQRTWWAANPLARFNAERTD
jgi:hypothetical protein